MYRLNMAGEFVLLTRYHNNKNIKLLNIICLTAIVLFCTHGISASTEETQLQSVLYVSNSGTNSILRYNASTGAFISTFVPSGSGGLQWPEGITFGPDGNLYISSFSSDSILRYNGRTGAFIDTFVPVGSGGLNGPHGLTFGPDNYLYVSSYFTRNILRYHGITGDISPTYFLQQGETFSSANQLALLLALTKIFM